jgi:hypothetical protein
MIEWDWTRLSNSRSRALANPTAGFANIRISCDSEENAKGISISFEIL